MHISSLLLFLPLGFALAHAPPRPAHRRLRGRSPQAAGPFEFDPAASNDTSSSSASVLASSSLASSASQVVISSQLTTTAASSTTTTLQSIAASSTTTTSTSSVIVSSSASSSSDVVFSSSSTSTETPSSSIVSTTSSSTSSAIPTTSTTVVVVVTASTSSARLSSSSTSSKTSSAISSATEAASSSSTKSTGIGKTTLIIIIVVACVVGLAGAGWTAFRKWKLKPSNRFDKRMKPIDFTPRGDIMDDEFLEKTLHRSASVSSADRQRQQFVSELDPNYVDGVPSHDFTAGAVNMAGQGSYDHYNQDTYHQDPYAHAEEYEYGAAYQQHAYPPGTHDYPSQDTSAYPHPDDSTYSNQDAPVHDGYTDLHRGNSGSSHSHNSAPIYPAHDTFPSSEHYLGRPTGGADGPYAQAAQYRGY